MSLKLRFTSVLLAAVLAVSLSACSGEAETDTGVSEEMADTAVTESAAKAEWTLDDIAGLSDIVAGITDRGYAAGEGAAYKIHEDVTYDRGIVYTVLFNTASVRFGTPGTYDMTYWVYFDAAALKVWADENGVSLDIPDTGRLAAWVSATVTVTEAEDEDAEDAEADADEAAEDAASGGSGDESASAGAGSGSESASSGSSKNSGSGSSKSASSGSSKSSSASCSHNWVDEGHYESVLVQAAYDEKVSLGKYYVCLGCGYYTRDTHEIDDHTAVERSAYSVKTVYDTVHHDAVYETQWVSSYKCSKCGATK